MEIPYIERQSLYRNSLLVSESYLIQAINGSFESPKQAFIKILNYPNYMDPAVEQRSLSAKIWKEKSV